jgi:predicted ATPase
MPRYILTGTPGAGKTAVLRSLEVHGYAVVEEAATDVIALVQANGNEQPWTDPAFIDKILALQRQRQRRKVRSEIDTVSFDRSPVCTLALTRYLGFAAPRSLEAEVAGLECEGVLRSNGLLHWASGFHPCHPG